MTNLEFIPKRLTFQEQLKAVGDNYDIDLFDHYTRCYEYIDLRILKNVKNLIKKGKSWGLEYKIIMNTRVKLIKHFNDWLEN